MGTIQNDKKTLVQVPLMRERVGHLIMAGVLAVSMAVPASLAMSGEAYAADGSITVTKQANADATYDVYRVFTADIDGNNKAQHIAWGSDATKTAVVTFLKANGYDDWLVAQHHAADAASVTDAIRNNPQNAAEYINTMISNSEGINTPKWVNADTFADKLAEAVSKVSGAKEGVIASGAVYTAAEGYVLLVTTPSTLGQDDMGTAAIWVPLGGSTTTITEKAAKPTLTKQVKEDSTQEWGETADAEFGQDVEYKLDVTMPSNLNTLKTFKGTFTDTLPGGMTVDTNTVEVTVDGQTATKGTDYTVSFENQVLTVVGNDWKTVPGAGAGKVIEVTYKAKFTNLAETVFGNDGNKNVCNFTYTNNPMSDSEGTPTTSVTPDVDAKAFIYQLKVDKFDKATDERLAGAKFVIKNAAGKYQDANNNWTATKENAKQYTTGTDGSFLVQGIDADTYTLEEVEAPNGYAPLTAAVTVALTHTLPATAADSDDVAITATVSGGLTGTVLEGITQNAGQVNVKVVNDKMVQLALTGAEGVGLGGVAVVAIGLGWYLIRRKRSEKDVESASAQA